jgi:hypothetical protein
MAVFLRPAVYTVESGATFCFTKYVFHLTAQRN